MYSFDTTDALVTCTWHFWLSVCTLSLSSSPQEPMWWRDQAECWCQLSDSTRRQASFLPSWALARMKKRSRSSSPKKVRLTKRACQLNALSQLLLQQKRLMLTCWLFSNSLSLSLFLAFALFLSLFYFFSSFFLIFNIDCLGKVVAGGAIKFR